MAKEQDEPSCGCGEASPEDVEYTDVYSLGCTKTPAGCVPTVDAAWRRGDYLGWIRVRLGIRRAQYAVEPGLYAIGSPDKKSPVLVSANYKFSFDALRRELGGLKGAWILVLDTKGVNVWCAAGKGTFGTDELVARIKAAGLKKVVGHNVLILPQLGAPGVAAHEVKKATGFRVVWGPVRAVDLPAFLAAGMKSFPEMRRVRFDLKDRLAVAPVEMIQGFKYFLGLALVVGLLKGPWAAGWLAGIYLAGGLLTPALLPLLPFRSFAIKGALVGLLLGAWIGLALRYSLTGAAGLAFLGAAISGFLTLNLTGCSTFTSPSGVKKEMKYAIPGLIAVCVLGVASLAASAFWRLP
jgi:hypothetical protein